MAALHTRCRSAVARLKYPGTSAERVLVPDAKVSWTTPWEDYAPTNFTLESLRGKPWADKDLGPDFNPKWNALDGALDRRSHEGTYSVVGGGPVNPRGRTGLTGRGRLGRWGPNHAADAVVTRWAAPRKGETQRVLQFVAIKRRDSGMWAIPGGFVDPGESPRTAMRREFHEETLNAKGVSAAHDKAVKALLAPDHEKLVYVGYVDDSRNTDQAWIETTAGNFHFDNDVDAENLQLLAGDDAVKADWVDVSPRLELHANHIDIIAAVAKLHGIPWTD